jgi:hypothetical protein
MASSKVMPRPSDFALPAQSSGCFLCDVATDLVVAQVAKAHLGGNTFDLKVAGARVEHSQCGVEHHRLSAHALKLRDRARLGAGLAEHFVAQVGDLVAADDERVRPAPGDRARLLGGQALGGRRGASPGRGVSSVSGRSVSNGRWRRSSSILRYAEVEARTSFMGMGGRPEGDVARAA